MVLLIELLSKSFSFLKDSIPSSKSISMELNASKYVSTFSFK